MIEQPRWTKTDRKEERALAGESVRVRRFQAEGVARAKAQCGKVWLEFTAWMVWLVCAGKRQERRVVGETGRGRRTWGLRGTERCSGFVRRRGETQGPEDLFSQRTLRTPWGAQNNATLSSSRAWPFE